ncbi:metabolite traffic protein EboE [Nocardiopsis sp. RSe5-2]|uniref:Metabolite traffic protein EboE n=1 Tax=Nocardiopsis endophytica TaxID=3018445 RepID=A0ABT4U637_9ACTN|nr:metabolite traffic protein EboE [Nocardiopsis endophytica]MDA2812410.1 metabolite traffic protein EboE [Nocardiopsis endophytica]
MRMRHPDGTTVHIAYCTNVHPAEDVDGLIAQIRRYGSGVREALAAERLGLGLWLPAPAARALAASAAETKRLRAALDAAGCEVVTLNAFPYARFHAARVKHDVFAPDWTAPERLEYTLDCARVLARLMPDDAVRGSISTVPLGWREGWGPERTDLALANLDRLAGGLDGLASEEGRTIRVGLEPEPGCVVETTAGAAAHLGGRPRPSGSGSRVGPRVGVCLDTCHLAVGFEEPAGALERLRGVGLPVVKLQASAAVEAPAPGEPGQRAALEAFAEDRFLHQVREGPAVGGDPGARDDLPEALGGADPLPGRDPWRVHFHVPVHRPPAAPLTGTGGHLAEVLRHALGGAAPVTDHVEVETYTWSVLPESERPADDAGLIAGIAAEMAWTRDRLGELGLEEV